MKISDTEVPICTDYMKFQEKDEELEPCINTQPLHFETGSLGRDLKFSIAELGTSYKILMRPHIKS